MKDFLRIKYNKKNILELWSNWNLDPKNLNNLSKVIKKQPAKEKNLMLIHSLEKNNRTIEGLEFNSRISYNRSKKNPMKIHNTIM